jgi:beta-xylosidase
MEWNYQPRPQMWSLTERKGWLRLHAFRPVEPDNLLKAGNTLTQRSYRTRANEVVVKLDISGMADGQKAGLTHFGSPNYSAIGVACEGTTKTLEFRVKGALTKGPVVGGNSLWLKSTWGLDGKSRYFYSLDGVSFTAFGPPYQLMWGAYRGDRSGIFSYNNKADAGHVDVDYFQYKYSK